MISKIDSLKHLLCNLNKKKNLYGTVLNCNPLPSKPRFLHVCHASLLKTLVKGKFAQYEQFLLCLKYFLPFWRTFCTFLMNLKLLLSNSLKSATSKRVHPLPIMALLAFSNSAANNEDTII